MNMKIDQRLISWPRYSKYEIISAPNGRRYIRPTEESHPVPFHYVKEKESMVIDAVNVGMLVLGKKSEAVIEKAVLEFDEAWSAGPDDRAAQLPGFHGI